MTRSTKAAGKGADRRAMGALSAGHLLTDLNQGAVAALLPFVVAEQGLSLVSAGNLVFAVTVSLSAVQPLFGIFYDRRPMPALMPLGVLLAGVGVALVARSNWARQESPRTSWRPGSSSAT
jgi:FSR family fosmidomycin resistance protein-like MFS transporter